MKLRENTAYRILTIMAATMVEEDEDCPDCMMEKAADRIIKEFKLDRNKTPFYPNEEKK